MSKPYDFAIVGGGIVGLSTAMALGRRFPMATILLLEKEDGWARHQTGHNSGVIHSGIYYKPGSFKARFAQEGNKSLVKFCIEQNIAYEICGKVIVATDETELPLLDSLYHRGLSNNLAVLRIDCGELAEIEPHVRGLRALRVSSTGIVDYGQVCHAYKRIAERQGGTLRLGTRVLGLDERTSETVIETVGETYSTKMLINCAGLHSDRVARLGGAAVDMRIVPFRGEYYEIRPERRYLVKHLIYPVPNPAFPFLGVHYTRNVCGRIEAGPNAVLAFAREGYRKSDLNVKDLCEVVTYGGFWKLALKYWKEGGAELIRSFSKTAFLHSLQRLIPEIQMDDLIPAHAGVRAQALLPDGRLVDDFYIAKSRRGIHVCNAPSPAATASLEIGRHIANSVDAPY